MALPWVRLDANIASHDKTIRAMGMRGGKGAMCLYVFALGWAGGQGTDGHIPTAALPMLHGTKAEARILVTVGLWEEVDGGWHIHNFHLRQETSDITAKKREQAREAANVRWNGAKLRAVRP